MKMKILITAFSSYDFENKEKERVKGLNLEYLANSIKDENRVGYFSLKQAVPYELINKINKVPGYYEADIKMVTTKDRKSVLTLEDFKFLKEQEFDL